MISCDTFRERFAAATEDPVLLEHVRACDGCMAWSADADPDILFRALGGGEMMPPGGLDAFVGDVMREVHLRSTESVMAPQRHARWARGLAAAATLALAVTGGMFVSRFERTALSPVRAVSVHRGLVRAASAEVQISRPVVESYDSKNATIVEVPAEGAGDVQVVMVFDESLPADL